MENYSPPVEELDARVRKEIQAEPRKITKIKAPNGNNMDVVVELEDGRNYSLTVVTPAYYEDYIGRGNRRGVQRG